MSLTRAIARNTLIQFAGRAVSLALALIVLGIMTRALGPVGFGGYATIISFLQFFGIVVDFGLTLTANRMLGAIPSLSSRDGRREEAATKMLQSPSGHGSAEGGERGRAQAAASTQGAPTAVFERTSSAAHPDSTLMSNLMTIRFFSALIFLGMAPLVALLFPYPATVKMGMFLTTLSFLAIIMGQTLVPLFQKELRMGYVVASELAGRVVLLIGVAMAAYLRAGLLAFMGAVVISSIVQYLVLRFYAGRYITLRFAFDQAVWKDILQTSWPIGVSIIFNLIYLKADTIFLSVLQPQATVGFYSASYRVIDQFTALATMFIGLVLPPLTAAFVARDTARFKKIYQGAFDGYAVIAFPLLVGALVLGVPLMRFIAGEEFGISGTILGIHMVAMTTVFFSTFFGHVVVVLNKQHSMIKWYAINAAFGLMAYALTIPRFGMFGAAWSTVGTEMLILIMTAIVVISTTRIVPSLTLVWKSIISALLMGYLLHILPALPVLLLVAIGVAVYGLALYALGGIKKEMLREIISIRSLP